MTPEEINEKAMHAFFASVMEDIDPDHKHDLGGWASMAYDKHPDIALLAEISDRLRKNINVALAREKTGWGPSGIPKN
jgi:hypothetical protein